MALKKLHQAFWLYEWKTDEQFAAMEHAGRTLRNNGAFKPRGIRSTRPLQAPRGRTLTAQEQRQYIDADE